MNLISKIKTYFYIDQVNNEYKPELVSINEYRDLVSDNVELTKLVKEQDEIIDDLRMSELTYLNSMRYLGFKPLSIKMKVEGNTSYYWIKFSNNDKITSKKIFNNHKWFRDISLSITREQDIRNIYKEI